MSQDYHYYEPASGHGLAHDPFNAIIAPRPIGWISSQSREGQVNLAPYSFFNAFNYTPPIIGFASVGYKDTVKNIEETGEFCWNLVSKPLLEKMNQTSAMVDAQTDEFTLSDLPKGASRQVAVPHVAASPAIMECRKTQIIRLQDSQGKPCDTWMVLGEVVAVHLHRDTLRDGSYQTLAGEPVLRAGGPGDYFTLSEANKFFLARPQ
ncbi:flavin reductase family protein [Salinimonas sediminis]|uniref:Flavin reductase family protein n=1 Tax=Salinimonas sediminis TaxID=2303538 RepID=A0A346NHU1_9ALTE|nr:flavin reductase family protein [Salinimonas sediminis]AXR05098.1 flavin reductase family protein [Salinimonas sediminis]